MLLVRFCIQKQNEEEEENREKTHIHRCIYLPSEFRKRRERAARRDNNSATANLVIVEENTIHLKTCLNI